MIENEFKFVLDQSRAQKLVDKAKVLPNFIQQGYLFVGEDRYLRARKSHSRDGVHHRLEFKMKLEDGRSIEPPTGRLSPEEWAAMYDRCDTKIEKLRYPFKPHYEIDFFMNEGGVYLVMAEVELAPDEELPPLDDWFEEMVFYRVKQGDPRFDNPRLADSAVVDRLLKDVCRDEISLVTDPKLIGGALGGGLHFITR